MTDHPLRSLSNADLTAYAAQAAQLLMTLVGHKTNKTATSPNRPMCVSLEPRRRKLENITILPLAQFLEELWAEAYR